MDITAVASMVDTHMHALADLLEGTGSRRRTQVVYQGFIGDEPELIKLASQASAAAGLDAVIAVFDPEDMAGGPCRTGIAMGLHDCVRLQFGQLWLAANGRRALLIPRAVDDRFGHYRFVREQGRFVRLAGHPAKNLERGIERAAARLAELTIARALSDAA